MSAVHAPGSDWTCVCGYDFFGGSAGYSWKLYEAHLPPAPLTIPLPWSKPPLTGNRTRGNPYARANEVKAAKETAQYAIRAANLEPIVGANITLHWRINTRHRRDADNLAPTLKVCQDALVAEGVLPEDSWVTVPSATCRIHPPNGDPAAMWIELTDVTPYGETA